MTLIENKGSRIGAHMRPIIRPTTSAVGTQPRTGEPRYASVLGQRPVVFPSRLFRVVTAVLIAASVLGESGCAITWTGHGVPMNSLGKLEIGKTTPAEVEVLLGKPEDVLSKPYEQTTVYVYRSVVSTSAWLGIPGFSVGRAKQTGFVLNVYFKNGVLLGHDITELKERILF